MTIDTAIAPDVADVAADLPTLRAELRAAISRAKSEAARLDALQQAATRAKEESWQADRRRAEAEAELRQRIGEGPQRAVYQYLNNATEEVDPVSAAHAEVEAATAEAKRLDNLQAGLQEEIARVQVELDRLRLRVWDCAGRVVLASPEYQELIKQHRDAWILLRSVRNALKTVNEGVHNRLPQQYLDEASIVEPTEATAIGFKTNKRLSTLWRAALEDLSANADAVFPGAPQTSSPVPLRHIALPAQPLPNGNGGV